MRYNQWLDRFCTQGQGIIEEDITLLDEDEVVQDILSGRINSLENGYE